MTGVKGKKPLYIAIMWRGSLPHGMALTNRFIAFAKGLAAIGEAVVMVCMVPALRGEVPPGFAKRGSYEGFEYVYTGRQIYGAGGKAGRFFQRAAGFILGVVEIYRRKKRGQIDVLFFPGLPSLQMAILLLVGRLLKTKVVHEQNEHPFFEAEERWFLYPERWFYLHVLVRFCSGVEVISTALERLYCRRIGRHSELLVVPAIVDTSRFVIDALDVPPPLEGPYIAWCGSRWDKKDGVHQLVGAFGRIAGTHPSMKLLLIAPADGSRDFQRVQDMLTNSTLEGRVIMTGAVSRDDMPRYLANAALLALARPRSLQADYGFPTKLPEYLASGRPVLVTRVGDIPLYLKDGVNAYLVDPDDEESLAERLAYILANPAEARLTGEKGRLLAATVFSNVLQAGRLADFLRSLR